MAIEHMADGKTIEDPEEMNAEEDLFSAMSKSRESIS